LRKAIEPTLYVPSPAGQVFILRTAADPMLLAGTVRRTINEATPSLLIDRMKSQSELVDLQLFQERMMTRLTTIFGLLALALAAIGIYGVVAYSVTRRTPEIAIRMSLGAMPGDIVRLVLAEGVLPAVIGVAAGLVASYGLTRLIAVALFGVKPLDALTYAGATFILLGIAALACYIPARRAMRVEPMTALRCE
jgi:putative ABC transport system permease protein